MITLIKKSVYFKIVSIFLSLCIFFQSSVSASEKVTLAAGTPIFLETLTAIKSDISTYGQIVDLRVKMDVKVGEVTVIPAGTTVKGQISKIQKAKGLGKPGFIEITVSSVPTIDGQNIPISGGIIYREGEDKSSEAIILGIVLCILFLTIKGKNAEVPIYTTINAVAAGTTTIEVKTN